MKVRAIILFSILAVSLSGCGAKPVSTPGDKAEGAAPIVDPAEVAVKTSDIPPAPKEPSVSSASEEKGFERLLNDSWKFCPNKVLGIEVRYPNFWKSCTATENGFEFLTGYQAYQVRVSMNVSINDPADANYIRNDFSKDPKDRDFYFEASDVGAAFKEYGFGGPFDINGIIIGDDVYQFFWNINSDQRCAKDCDGPWVPDNDVTRDQLFNIALSAKPLIVDEAAELREASSKVVKALAGSDMQSLSSLVGAGGTICFSPYANISKNLVCLPGNDLSGALDGGLEYLWGAYDGSGEPIKLTFSDYYQKFIYNKDYQSQGRYISGDPVTRGNMINNLKEAYPNGVFSEYYVGPTEEGGMDWGSLMLIFERVKGDLFLRAIVHDQWTI